MKQQGNTSNGNDNDITVSEETMGWVKSIAKLDEVFNGLSAKDSDDTEANYKGFRDQLVSRMAQCIARNLCVDARCI